MIKWLTKILNKPIDWFDTPEKIRRSTYAFMPAVLEIQETPPSPIGRAIIWTIMLLFVLTLVWGYFGKLDVVAVAPGKIIPSDRVKTIQPLEIGKINTIHVKEGQYVQEGDVLITLDTTATEADATRFEQQLYSLGLQKTRNTEFQKILDTGDSRSNEWLQNSLSEFNDVYDSHNQNNEQAFSKNEVNNQHQLLVEQINEYDHRKETLLNELEKRQSEKQSIKATVIKLERTLPLITERVDSLKKLMKKDLVARDQFLSLEQERIEQEQDLQALKAQHREIIASINEINSQLKTLKAEVQKTNLQELNETSIQISSIEQELIKANKRNHQQVIYSPINGTVQQLAVHTIGGVVTPAQELMLIVPEQSVLEVEALVLNKDIGFIEEGQVAEVKIDTFNFTKYGTIDAEVINLSNDAISDENLGLVYMAKILIHKTKMQVNNKLVNLTPGMSVNVEIKTGKRRVIEYFLSPLLRYKQESIRER